MNEIIKLIPKPQIKVLDGIELTIYPLGVDRLDYFTRKTLETNPEDEIKSLKEVIKEALPGTTDESIGKLDMVNLRRIMELIAEVNGVEKGSESKIQKIKDVIAARQSQVQSNQPKQP